MTFDKKSRICRVLSVVLALALVVPVGMLFSTNAIAENTETTTLTEPTDVDTILLGETSINPPPSLQIDNPWNITPPMPEPPEDILENITYVTVDNITYEGPDLPVFEHIEEPYDITLVTMNSPTGPLYEGERRPVQVILKNKADHNIININVNIYDQLDEGEPVWLMDLFYGCIPAFKDQTKTFTWEPEAGTHYLTLDISYIDNGVEQWNEEEFGFYVMRDIQTNQSGNPGGSPDSYPGDPTLPWYIYGDTILQNNQLILDDGAVPDPPIYIWEHRNDIIVTSTGHLTIENSDLPIVCLSDGQYSITVENGGTLDVIGDSLITATSSLYQGYGFVVHGTLNILGTPTVNPTIQWMYGDMGDEKIPAGIQLYRDSNALFQCAKITEGESHNIYADGAEFTVIGGEISGAQSQGIGCGIYMINCAEMHIPEIGIGGDGYTHIHDNGHSGIYSVVSSVDIDGVKVESNSEDGVSVIGDVEWQPGGWQMYGNNFEPWGKPAYTPGVDVGYFIWLDDIPERNTWHIRWCGDGTGYTFDGVITCDGDISYPSFTLVGSIDSWDVLNPTTITFTDLEDLEAPFEEDGFDFRFDGSKIIFEIQVLDKDRVRVNTDIHIGETGLLPEFPYDQFRLYQMRPPVLHDFEISNVKTGLRMIGRSLGEISEFNIQAKISWGMYLFGIRQTQISDGHVESETIEAEVIHLSPLADYNTLSNLELVSWYSSGISIGTSKHNKFQNVAVELLNPLVKDGFGIGLFMSGGNTFQGCNVKGFQCGFVVQMSSTNIIESTVTGCVFGINIWEPSSKSAGVIVSSCILKGNVAGIYAFMQINLLIEDTIISENGGSKSNIDTYGIWINEPVGATIRNSYVSDNQDPDPGDSSGGIVITGGPFGSADVTIEDCTEIRGSDYGIYASSCTNLNIRNAIIANNDYGIYTYLSEPTITNNMIGGEFTITSVENETVHGPTYEGETGPIYLANGNIINCTMYVDVAGEWMLLQEEIEYTLNYTTGEIDTSPIELFEDGWIFHAYYNYSIDIGDSNNYGIYSIQSSTQIIGNTISSNDEDGIYIDNEGDYSLISTIEDNTFSGNRRGIYISNAFATITDNNRITLNRGSGIVLENAEGDISWNTIKYNHRPRPPPEEELTGIEVLGCNGVWIHNNNVSYNGANIYLYESTNINIEWNTMVDATAVIQIYPTPPPPRGIHSISSQMSASNNKIWGTIIGIQIENADATTVVRYNEIYPIEGGSASLGVYLMSASPLVEWNTFDGIGTGIYCVDNSNAVIDHNIIINCGSIGIYSEWSSPTITQNTIYGNMGWGILCEFGAPTNAGDDGQGLIDDNYLGDNELGWIKQIWDVQIQVTDAVGTPQDEVLVEVIPYLEIPPIFTGYTDINGLTDNFIATQYVVENGGIITVKNPHVVQCDGSLSAWLDFKDNGIYVVEI